MDGKSLSFPYAKADVPPTTEDPVARLLIGTEELGGQGLTYYLRSGAEGTVMADWVLEYNLDPDYMRDALLYRLTCEAQDRMEAASLEAGDHPTSRNVSSAVLPANRSDELHEVG